MLTISEKKRQPVTTIGDERQPIKTSAVTPSDNHKLPVTVTAKGQPT